MCEDKAVLSYGRKYGGPLESKFEVNKKFCGHIHLHKLFVAAVFVASYPGSLIIAGEEKRAWFQSLAHALNFLAHALNFLAPCTSIKNVLIESPSVCSNYSLYTFPGKNFIALPQGRI